MKPFQVLTLFGLLCVAGSAAAGSASLSPFPHKVLPVLVEVNSHGDVTSASPAYELNPSLTRLLRQNLDEMITKPAHRDGRAVSSQFVINLAMKTTPREEGGYFAHFTYVSTSPVPNGSWYWVHMDGRRLALARQGGWLPRPSHFERAPRAAPARRWDNHQSAPPPPSNPPVQSNSRHTSKR